MWVPRWVVDFQYNARIASFSDKYNRDCYRIEDWIKLDKGRKKDKEFKWTNVIYKKLLFWINQRKQVSYETFWTMVRDKKLDGYMIFYLLEMLHFLSLGKYLKKFRDMEPKELYNYSANEIFLDISEDDKKALKELGKRLRKGK